MSARGGGAGPDRADAWQRGACPDEGTLVALLDGALKAETEQEVAGHVDAHPACRARMTDLRRRDRAVGSWLEELDPPPPPREAYDLGTSGRRRRGRPVPWWAAAAAGLLVVAVLAGPGRAWVASGVRSLLDGQGGEETPAAVRTSGATSLVPNGDELLLTFTSPRTRGSVRIEPAPDARFTLREPDSRIRVVVGAAAVRVENEAVPAGDYRVEVPASLRRLRLRVAAGRDTVLDVQGLVGRRTVELSPPPR